MTRVIRLFSILFFCAALAACGQSGPLTLPDKSAPEVQSGNQPAVPDASEDGEPVPDPIPEAVPDPAEVPDDESI
jgi:predicted small lipoprotein YifL